MCLYTLHLNGSNANVRVGLEINGCLGGFTWKTQDCHEYN